MDYRQPKFYRFSEDSLWLAHTAARAGGRGEAPKTLLDAGCGCGVVGIETANRLPSVRRLVLLEPQKDFSEHILFNRRFLREGVEVEYVQSSLEDWDSGQKFDLIASNPPYFKEGEGRASDDLNRFACRAFRGSDLVRFSKEVYNRLSLRGEAYVLGHASNSDLLKVFEFFGEEARRVEERKLVSIFCLSKHFS